MTRRPYPASTGRFAGFTLIEVMIVTVIVAILAAIAIPSYVAFIARGHRSEARMTLTHAAQWMERWRTEHTTYQDPLNLPNPTLPPSLAVSPGPPQAPIYTITFAVPTTPGFYSLVATPINPGPMANDACGNLTLDSTGLRGKSGPADINLCWGR